MSKFSVVVFEESSGGRPAEPFLATRDPKVVQMVRDAITDRLRKDPTPNPRHRGGQDAPATGI